ncbi:related to cleavage and polyadenylation specificity factor, 160 kDa subunit [Ustilago sp. UG-2017b]|nr:related to cleavage and polyadenylation specificity factor, 160 kDa subunit [Ustilago sp. UG-2017b]
MASGYHQQEIAPGGCSHAVLLHLHYHSPAPSKVQQSYQHRGRLRTQLVTARDDLLSIYDVYERPGSSASANPSNGHSSPDSTSHRLVLIRKHSLFGTVTGLQRIQTLSTSKDSRDRLLVSFTDAKLALLEWNHTTDDLETVSIHTYERAPQLLNGIPHLFQPNLNIDPLSRCAALLLPHDALAILPFYRDAAEFEFEFDDGLDLDLNLDFAGEDKAAMQAAVQIESLPYSPSFVLTMREVDPKIRNLKDFCFLPGFQKPTVAVLFAHSPICTGLLAERKDNFSVYLFTLDLSASLDGAMLGSASYSFDDATLRSMYPVLTTSSSLSYDCLYMLPCPQTLGGVLVVCMSSILHVDQSGRVVATALNGWFNLVSAIEPESLLDLPEIADLQGSQLVFTGETEGVLTLVHGDVYRFTCEMDGRSIEGFRLERMQQSFAGTEELVPATGSPASCLAFSPHDSQLSNGAGYLFAATMAGDSTLYNLVPVNKPLSDQEAAAQASKPEPAVNDIDLDLDDDLYGSSDAVNSANAQMRGGNKDKTVLTLRKVDEIRSHGGLHSIARRKLTADESSRGKRYGLVGACGSGNQAGIVYLDPRYTPQDRTKLVAEGGEERQQSFANVFVVRKIAERVRMIATNYERDSSIAFTAPADVHAPTSRQGQATWSNVVEFRGATLCAGALLGGNEVARITANSVQVLSADSLQVLDEVAVDAIQHASIDAEQYLVLYTTSGETLIYNYDLTQRKFEPLTLPLALNSASLLSANVFRDSYGHMQSALQPNSASTSAGTAVSANHKEPTSKATPASRPDSSLPNDDEDVDYDEDLPDPATAAAPTASYLTVASAPAYLFILTHDSIMRIFALPNLTLVWQNTSLSAQPQRLRLERTPHTELAREQVAELTSARLCHVGDTLSVVSLTSDHFLTVYKGAWGAEGGLMFNKVLVEVLNAPVGGVWGGMVQLRPCYVPIREAEEGMGENAIVVLGGGKEVQASILCWTEAGGYRLLDWDDGDLTSLFPIRTSEGKRSGEYAYCTRSGSLYLGRHPPGLYSSTSWISSVVRTGRQYTHITTHPATSTVIASSVNPHPFILFDDEGEPIPSASSVISNLTNSHPTFNNRGSLELFIPEDPCTPIDGYEFDQSETVTSLTTVTLDSPSSATGRKQFIAAGTTTYHGEDRTCKGSVYLFEIIQVVSSRRFQVGRDLRLKLICRDGSNAPVTALAELHGFLLSTSGQKLYVRALEKEEWLISVAFLDCPFYITSIRLVKNFVLLSDAKKGLWFLAFQEDPYRFVDLGSALDGHCANLGEFLVHNDKLSLVSTSGAALGGISGFGQDPGVIRLYEYNPSSPTSLGGQRLLLRTEYSTPSPTTCSLSARGRWLSDSELRGREQLRNKLLLSKSNGSLDSLASVEEKVAKRLHLLQGQLVRSVLHTAALNPRAFRQVRNDFVSRPLYKGVLDARLLDAFKGLSRPKMGEAVRTLAGLFDGLDVVKSDQAKRKRGEDLGKKFRVKTEDGDEETAQEAQENTEEAEQEEAEEEQEEEEQEEEEQEDFEKQEQLRLQSEQKRVQLVLKDLLRLRVGFEQV